MPDLSGNFVLAAASCSGGRKRIPAAGEPISYAEKDNRKKSPEPLEDQKDKLKKQHIITVKGRVTDAAGEP